MCYRVFKGCEVSEWQGGRMQIALGRSASLQRGTSLVLVLLLLCCSSYIIKRDKNAKLNTLG